MFEATGMGALLITDSKKNMDEFFKSGSEVITYKSAEDLTAKIKYYLKNEKERLKIAKSGQKRTLKDHTYKKRMIELDKILRKYI
jgi:spore maturation protein CgeB